MYHSISDQDDPGRHAYYQTNTRPEVFAQQMQFLADNDYKVISLTEAISLLSGVPNQEAGIPKPEAGNPSPEARLLSGSPKTEAGREAAARRPIPCRAAASLKPEARGPKPRKYCVLTFDDGYRDFYAVAWPILKKHGFTATMFLPTGFIGNERNALNGKDCLTWNEVQALAQNGTAFGAHTVSHVQLYKTYTAATEQPNSSFPPKRESTHGSLSFLRRRESIETMATIDYELRDSKQAIEETLGKTVEHYSYAYAFPEHDEKFVSFYDKSLREAGYQGAVSTRIGTARPGDNPYCLKRLPVNSCDDAELLQAKLEGGYDWLHRLQYIKKKMSFVG